MFQLAFLISCPFWQGLIVLQKNGSTSVLSPQPGPGHGCREVWQEICSMTTENQVLFLLFGNSGTSLNSDFLWLHERAPRNLLTWTHYDANNAPNNKTKSGKKPREVQYHEYLVAIEILWFCEKIARRESPLSLRIFLATCVDHRGVQQMGASAISGPSTHFPGSVNGNWVLEGLRKRPSHICYLYPHWQHQLMKLLTMSAIV